MSATGMSAPAPSRRQLVDLGAMAVLLGVGVLSFGPVFDGRAGYLAAGVGVLLGGAAAVLGAWRRWGFFAVAALVLAAYFLAGGPVALPDTLVAGVLPSAETLHRLLMRSFQSWRDLLTVAPPAIALACTARWRSALVPVCRIRTAPSTSPRQPSAVASSRTRSTSSASNSP